jgi:hypothetical protein
MAASTRSGFPGGFTGGDGPTDVQSARTLYGHDLHLEPGAVDVSPAQPVSQPDEPVDLRPVTTEEEFTPPARFPSHTGKSRFPALARLFGRWNTHGRFEARIADDDDLDVVPRERFLRPLAIVVATSAISFFIVVALLKLRDSTGAEPPQPLVSAPAATQTAAPSPAPAPAPAAAPRPAPVPTAAVPVPAPRPVPERARPISDVLQRAIARREPPGPAVKRTAARHTRSRIVVPADPDSPMPLSF